MRVRILLVCLWLSACAGPQPTIEQPETLFRDELFAQPRDRISADDVFALSDPMRQYLATEIARQVHSKGPRQALIDALYTTGQLKLRYDATKTHNASEAFAARAGNCLSLVIMTAAFAKEMGLQVEYRSAVRERTWSRSNGLILMNGHVNLSLEVGLVDAGSRFNVAPLTIDFLPGDEIRGLQTWPIDEATVVAMYMNNRAAEALVQEDFDDAYAWARESIRHSPGFVGAYNTLGVVYVRHGDLAQATEVFRRILVVAPENTLVMYNLAGVLRRQGYEAEAAALDAQLARIEPYPPFYFFNLGQEAMQREDFRTARRLFAKEVARADYYHEFHFWLAIADFRLGELDEARKELALAMNRSTTRGDRDLYAAKLDWLGSLSASRGGVSQP
jgi:tetratricopeptide (TPR) repeat protein